VSVYTLVYYKVCVGVGVGMSQNKQKVMDELRLHFVVSLNQVCVEGVIIVDLNIDSVMLLVGDRHDSNV